MSVDDVLIVDPHQGAPYVCALQIEGENPHGILLQNELEPCFQSERLGQIFALPKGLDTTSQFTDNLNRQKQLMFCSPNEINDAWVGLWSLAHLTDHVGIEKEHG